MSAEHDALIASALAGKLRNEVMGPHFCKHHLGDGRVLHRFTAGDGGFIHDHPWSFESTVLRGGYTEVRYYPLDKGGWETSRFHRRPGHVLYVAADCIHTIVRIHGRECWTLIRPGPWERVSRQWRFGDVIESRAWNEEHWTEFQQEAA